MVAILVNFNFAYVHDLQRMLTVCDNVGRQLDNYFV